MDIDARTLACWYENAWDDCAATPASLRDQLRLMERSAASLFASGSIGSVSKNSASQSYAGAGFGRFSVAQIQQGYRMLIELYDTALTECNCLWNAAQQYPLSTRAQWFVQKYPTFPADPDLAVNDKITCILGNPVESYQVDLSDLRLRPTIAPGIVQTW